MEGGGDYGVGGAFNASAHQHIVDNLGTVLFMFQQRHGWCGRTRLFSEALKYLMSWTLSHVFLLCHETVSLKKLKVLIMNS